MRKHKGKHKLSISYLGWDTTGVFKLIINNKVYLWYFVSSQFKDEWTHDLGKGYNKGRLLKKVERVYGRGKIDPLYERRVLTSAHKGAS